MEISIVKIKNIVDNLINWVRLDLAAHVADPTQSWLYEEFNSILLDDTNFYVQLKSMIEQGDTDSRKIETRLMFDRERANLPTIHIHYPNEEGSSGDNTLNTGFLGIQMNEGGNSNIYSRSFVGQYELIITGGNSLEVVMMYEFLDGLLIAAADTLSANFDIFKFSGKQLMANQEIIPYLTFYRAIGLSLQSKKIVRSLTSKRKVIGIEFDPIYTTDSQQPKIDTVSITITASSLNLKVGESSVITAITTKGGENPVHKWYINDTLIPDNDTDTLELTASETGMITIKCELLSSILYLNPRPATSNILTLTVTN